MSGGHGVYTHDQLGQNIFGWSTSMRDKIGSESYQKELEKVIRGNALKDFELSELVYDVLCLLHTYDYVFSDDWDEKALQEQIAAFKTKWLKSSRKDRIKSMIDTCMECLKEDLYSSLLSDITISNETVSLTDVRRVTEAWNSLSSVGIQPISRLQSESKRYKGLKARISEYGIDEVLNAIENIRQSDFLCGKNSSGWTVTFDWFVKPNNFPKVHDGNYNNQHGNSPKHESSFDLDEFDNFTMQSCQNRG